MNIYIWMKLYIYMAVCIPSMLPNKNGGGEKKKRGVGHPRQIRAWNVSVGYLGRDEIARYNLLKLLNDWTMYWANLYGLTVKPIRYLELNKKEREESIPGWVPSKSIIKTQSIFLMKKCLWHFWIEMSAAPLSLCIVLHHTHSKIKWLTYATINTEVTEHTLRDNFLKWWPKFKPSLIAFQIVLFCSVLKLQERIKG